MPDLEPLVDLGEDFDVPASGSWIVSRRSTIRRFRLAVPLCALLLLVAAAQSPVAAPLRLAAHFPVGVDASAMIDGSDLYVYDTLGGHDGIRAYRLDGGGLRWSASTPELATETTMQYVGGNVIVSMADTDSSGEHTVTFDARTGRRLWANDLGFAVVATGGVLVESAPRPPGFNFVGTVETATYDMLDPRTGQMRWSVHVPDNCLTVVVRPGGAPATGLVELCSNSAQLSMIDLADGRVTASRQVNLGNPADNFYLPPPDQMKEPQLVSIGETVLVAHANAPMPTIDAYATGDLHQVWSGLPVIAGQDLDQCGLALCVFDGESSGSVVDLLTGGQIGLVPPRGTAGPPDGSLVLLRVGDGVKPSGTAEVPVTAEGVSVSLPLGHDPTAPATWLARWHVRGSATGRATLIALLPVARPSCVTAAAYLACATSPTVVTVWKLP